MSLKALIITGDKVQDHEFIYPYYRLQEEGYTIEVATPTGPDVETKGYYGTKIPVTAHTNEIIVVDYELLILPGGAKAMEYLRQDKNILDFIESFHDNNRVIGSICHGAQLLISAGLCHSNRKISGYYSIKDDIENAGGVYIDEPVVTCERIVTSPHYKYLGPWMREVLYQAKVNIL